MDQLPELPRTLKKKEAKITPKVIAWLKANHHSSCAFEIKSSDGNTIPRSALKPHQKLALQDANSHHGIIHKLTDEARRQQPFDGFQLIEVPAYVIACFPKHGFCNVYHIDSWQGAWYGDEGLFKIML